MTVKRMLDVSFSETMRISKIASKMEAEGDNVISLAVGEPDFNTPDFINEAACESMKNGNTHYTAPQGIPELREEIAKISKEKNNLNFSKENVIITPTKQAIFMAVLAHLDDGAEAIITDPTWVSYAPMIKFADGIPRRVPLHAEKDFSPDPDEIADTITSRTNMIILNTPSNPTGMTMKKEDLKGIAELAIDNDLIVISDEVYENLIFEGEHHSIGSFDGMEERTITVSGFSKSYAMTGWRLGYAVAPEEIIHEMELLLADAISCTTSFAQKGGVEALRGPQDFTEMMMEEFTKRRNALVEGINEKVPGMSCIYPKGAFYAFPNIKETGMTSEEVAKYMLNDAGVALLPGTAFGSQGEGFLRISYAQSLDMIEKGIERMKTALKEKL